MSSLRLRIELVPKDLHYWNLRSDSVGLGKDGWSKLRRAILAERGPECAICGGTDNPHGHEVWGYIEKAKIGIAKLAGIEIVCGPCHYAHHWGFTQALVGEGKMEDSSKQALIEHFLKVNQCTRSDFDRHALDTLAEWKRRNRLKWRVDWGAYEPLIKAVQGRAAKLVDTKPVPLRVPCANCKNKITINFPARVHSGSKKRLGILYVCTECKQAGAFILPPGSMGCTIVKGALALFSADSESSEWKAEVGDARVDPLR